VFDREDQNGLVFARKDSRRAELSIERRLFEPSALPLCDGDGLAIGGLVLRLIRRLRFRVRIRLKGLQGGLKPNAFDIFGNPFQLNACNLFDVDGGNGSCARWIIRESFVVVIEARVQV